MTVNKKDEEKKRKEQKLFAYCTNLERKRLNGVNDV